MFVNYLYIKNDWYYICFNIKVIKYQYNVNIFARLLQWFYFNLVKKMILNNCINFHHIYL